MGKFIKKSYVNTIDSLTTGMINKVKNANYVFNNKPPVICDWFNINKEATTLDEGSKLEYVTIGKNSPIKYNLIHDAVFYDNGSIQIEIDLEYDEDGLSTTKPTISGIILPNTWVPYSGDHFILKQSGNEYIYRVNSVSYDTIDNDNNVYKFEAQLSQTGKSYIYNQVIDHYNMIINNVGTGLNPIIKSDIYDCIDTLDTILSTLKNNYIALFYNDKVQTFTCNGLYGNLYDPYVIEFLSRNNILSGADEYVYVHHEVPVSRTFAIDYAETAYRAIELKNKNMFRNQTCKAEAIRDIYSLFVSVKEDYYEVQHADYGLSLFEPINSELVSKVKTGEELEINNPKSYFNVIVKYFNDYPMNSNLLPLLENIKFSQDIDLFYTLPMVIYVLEYAIKGLMKTTSQQ